MLILLPPSEGKATPADGAPVDLDDLVFAESLGPARKRLLDGLIGLCEGPAETAVETLAIGAGQAEEVAINAGLRSTPAAPASVVYTGVLYDHLGFPTLSPTARERAESTLLIASGLWGLVRPGDRIPRYRFSMKPKLEGVGGLAAFWRPSLAETMEASGHDREGELILDLRSGAYSAAWKPKRARLITVRGFTERNGERKPISHMAKAIRGDVARAVLEAPDLSADPDDLLEIVTAAGFTAELGPGSLDVTVKAA